MKAFYRVCSKGILFMVSLGGLTGMLPKDQILVGLLMAILFSLWSKDYE